MCRTAFPVNSRSISRRTTVAISGESHGSRRRSLPASCESPRPYPRLAPRWREVGSLLLGLYDVDERLDHVGFVATISDAERPVLTRRMEVLVKASGFSGTAPGGPSRWSHRISLRRLTIALRSKFRATPATWRGEMPKIMRHAAHIGTVLMMPLGCRGRCRQQTTSTEAFAFELNRWRREVPRTDGLS